jgi:hypothetical protein
VSRRVTEFKTRLSSGWSRNKTFWTVWGNRFISVM